MKRPSDWVVRSTRVSLAAGAGALAVLVGLEGSVGGRLLRVLAVVVLGSVAVWSAPRVGRRTLGLIALLAGIVGIVVGAGIGVPHVVKAGWSLSALLALVDLAAGMMLLGMGAGMLVAAARGWRKVLALPIALGLLVLVLAPVSLALYATNVPPTPVGDSTPADRGLAYEDVQLSTTDGVSLSGWYVPSVSGAGVVLLHGSGSTRTTVLDQAVVLARHGYGVLLLDTRGHGRSGGDAMDFGWYGDRDLDAAVDFLETRRDIDPDRIAALGMSMGGEQAIGAAASDSRLRAVVAEGATGRSARDHTWLARDVDGWVMRGTEWVMYGFADLVSGAGVPVALRDAAAAAAPRPVLLIAAGEEKAEVTAGRHIRAGSPETVELWEVPGAGHTAGLSVRPQEWEARVVGFLGKSLAAP